MPLGWLYQPDIPDLTVSCVFHTGDPAHIEVNVYLSPADYPGHSYLDLHISNIDLVLCLWNIRLHRFRP